MSDTTALGAAVEGHDGILTIRAGENFRGWNGIHYKRDSRARMSARRRCR